MRRGEQVGLLLVWTAMAIATAATAGAQGSIRPRPAATVREFQQVIRTYPYSDPNPIPAVGRVYPYFRFDGYTDTPVDRRWTIVELENAYLRVRVMPEIGGKIWSAIDKASGKPFIYDNGVVKFRDIAMRGPWTSGGIEANYGIIGHTPNCATPVDYVTRTNADGSASVIIGVLDLLTRTPWRLEVRLPADAAYFTTTSFWHNATPLEQPYYTWMNTAVKAAGNLQLIYPGTHHIGHGGDAAPWPVDASGRDLSFYEQNDFGPYKSYHVIGRRTDFFGAYWHDEDFGMGRYARRDDKLGKKAWIWGLSRQGMIWERLLTDTNGQYVEVQSGRLFNQAAVESTATPFKHRGFFPYATDTWTEYWFPVKGTGGFVKANDLGALNVQREGRTLTLRFSPLEHVSDVLEVMDGDVVLHSMPVTFTPLENWSATVETEVPNERLRVRIGTRFDHRLAADDEVLSRPLEAPADFDWESVFGLHLKGRQLLHQREYAQARAALEACLKKDANYLPALVDLAAIRQRAGDAADALALARRAVSIDTYDPAANFVYGLASWQLGRVADAFDGFEVAALSPEYRSAAWTELARLHLSRGRLPDAAYYAAKSVQGNPLNLEGHQVLAVAERLRGRPREARAVLDEVLRLDPLNHLARFEQHVLSGDEPSRNRFVSGVRNEMPQETFLELAVWYHGFGRLQEARHLLELSPANAEVLYWLAYVRHAQGDAGYREVLARADQATPLLVFPFRAESAPVLDWAREETRSWKPRYYLALVRWGHHDVNAARQLLEQCGSEPDFAPFYAARARVWDRGTRQRTLADLERAAALDPRAWRFGRLLAEHHLEDRANDKALSVAERYHAAHPANYILGMLRAKALLLTGRLRDAAALLAGLNVLPYEGATEGRRLHREAHLLLAAEELHAGRPDAALQHVTTAREWPEHLGAGKPYPDNVDERVEDWIEIQALDRAGRAAESRALLDRLAQAASKPGTGRLAAALALKRAGREADADRALDEWARGASEELVAWGRALFAGESRPLPAGTVANEELRALAAVARL